MIRKPAIITAASIAGVVLAGGAAVGANIGILDAADNGPVGNLSAEAVVASPEPSSTPSDASDPTPDTTQTFAVDAAGDIDVIVTDAGLAIADVRTNPGWEWTTTDSTGDTITVRFSSSSDTLDFSARLNADGTIAANVDRPAPPAPTTPNTYDDDQYDDDYDDDRYDDDRYEDDYDDDRYDDDRYDDDRYDDDRYDDDHDDRYDDDDHDEYEGRDDDD